MEIEIQVKMCRRKCIYSIDLVTSSDFYPRSSRIRVDLLSYESKQADEREQNDWMAEKKLDGYQSLFYFFIFEHDGGVQQLCVCIR